MMKNQGLCFILVLLVLLAGCGITTPTRPSEFYMLSVDPGPPVSAHGDPAKPLSLGLGPLSMSDVYERPQIVTRPDPNQVKLAEFDRWAGDLKMNLEQVLAQNLMSRLNTDSVFIYPWSSHDEAEFQIAIRFFRFDGELGNVARIGGVWRLRDLKQDCELVTRRFQINERPDGKGYPALVRAMSTGVAQLSQEIAEQVAVIKPGCAK
ncbi:MAG: membrane integrity-associated transporter subunit PqiC [Gammaproteobacteria bacterium]|nr:membrane integrity-associated transporter subunit PqiC [Gammaproteobacteria bacterium]